MLTRCNDCPIRQLCEYNRKPDDSCYDIVSRYNAGLLLPVEAFENSIML